MNPDTVTRDSILPAASFLVPFAAGVIVFLGRRLPRAFAMTVTVAAAGIVLLAGLAMVARVTGGVVLTEWGNELRADALSALLVVVIGGVGLLAAIYSLRYVSRPGLLSASRAETAERRLPTFYGLVLWFLATMAWGCVTNNIIMLYVAVEATTLCSGLLVAFFLHAHGSRCR